MAEDVVVYRLDDRIMKLEIMTGGMFVTSFQSICRMLVDQQDKRKTSGKNWKMK